VRYTLQRAGGAASEIRCKKRRPRVQNPEVIVRILWDLRGTKLPTGEEATHRAFKARREGGKGNSYINKEGGGGVVGVGGEGGGGGLGGVGGGG